VSYANGAFSFAYSSGTAASAAQAQALIASAKYKNTASTGIDGVRTFTFSAVDSANNVTATAAVATISVNAVNPALVSVGTATAGTTTVNGTTYTSYTNGPLTTLDVNKDGVLGDQFIVTFREAVKVSNVASTANWALSGSTTLGTGATITALDAVTVSGNQYATKFLFTAGTGATYTTSTTLTITAANVIDTGGATATAAQVVTMTDIVAASAATPPSSISTDNNVNSTEKAASISIVFTTPAAVNGDNLLVYRDGVLVKTQAMTTGSTSTAVSLTGNDWGTVDGTVGITTRIQDAAGNLSVASSVKPVTVDTSVNSQISSITLQTDAAPTSALGAGDVIQVTFGETVKLDTTMLPSSSFGTGAAVSAVSAVNGYANTWNVTLGSGTTLSLGGSITFGTGAAGSTTLVQDLAGNRGAVTGTVPANLLDQPTSIVVGNVATNNVVDTTERGTAQAITLALAGAKSGDVVKLYMDGVQVGTATVSTNGQTSATINVSANAWGADGEHLLTADIQRGANSAIKTQGARSVYVAADGTHWSSSGILWFDPDTLSTTDTTFNTWTASAGGSSATRSGTTPPALVTGLNGGHQGLNMATYGSTTANKSYYTFSAPTGVSLPTNRNSISAFIASFQPTQDTNLNILMRYGQETYGGAIQLGIDNRAAGGNTTYTTLPQRLTLDLNGAWPFGADASGAVNSWVVAQFDTFNNNSNWAISSNGALSATGPFNQGTQAYVNFGSGSLRILGADPAGHSTNVVLGDEILASTQLNAAWAGEINTYLAAKYGSQGTLVTRSVSNTYNLTGSANKTALIDERLQLLDASSNDTVSVAGADYVQTGAGNDTLIIGDLSFRTLDGGSGIDTLKLSSTYSGSNTIYLSDYVSNSRGVSSGTGGMSGRVSIISAWTKGASAATSADNAVQAPDGTTTADQMTLTNTTTTYDYYRTYLGLTANTSYTFSIWVKLGTATNFDITLDNSATAGTIAGDKSYTATDGLSTSTWKRIDHTFTTDSQGAVNVIIGGVGTNQTTAYTQSAGSVFVWGAEMNLTSALPSVPTSQQFQDDARVTNNGFHKLQGFEVLDFSQSTAQQAVTIAADDVNQLSEDNKLWVKLGTTDGTTGASSVSDTLTPTGFTGSSAAWGYFTHTETDGTTVVYDRKWTGTSGSQSVELYASGGKFTKTDTGSLFNSAPGSDTLTGTTGADVFAWLANQSGNDVVSNLTKSQGDKLDLRELLAPSGFTLAKISDYLKLSQNGADAVLKIDADGGGNFSSNAQTITLTGAWNDLNVVNADSTASLTLLNTQHIVLLA
jgi:large repetitive protein